MTTALLISVLSIFFYASIAVAQPGGPVSTTVGTSERANLSGTAPATITAQAGNVTELDVTATAITQAWQGYFGNITGNIVLADSNNNQFYNWTGTGSISGEVYASRNSTIDWSTIGCLSGAEVATESSYLGKAASDADSVENTFSVNSHPEFDVGVTTITTNTCNSTNAYINNGTSSTDYYQVLLADDDSSIVYTALIDDDQIGFDGSNHDFQLLVGENGNATNLATTTYYFYIELS